MISQILVEHAEAFTSSRSAYDFGGFGRCWGVVNRSSGFPVLGLRCLHVFFAGNLHAIWIQDDGFPLGNLDLKIGPSLDWL